MRFINEIFCQKLREKDCWHPYHHNAQYSNAPKKTGKYKVMALFGFSHLAIELDAQWNGCDWIIPNDGTEVSGMVMLWKEKKY